MNFEINNEYQLKQYMPDKMCLKSLTTFFSAFSDDTRLKIIILLTIKPLCVTEISAVLNLNQTTTSHQLKLLKALNIVACDRAGKNIIYYIKNKSVEKVLDVTADCI